MKIVDWSIVVVYIFIALGIGIIFARRAGSSTSEYFIGGRNLPWWIVGTSMVATTFAADTPLAVTGIVAKNGIAGNWFWWNWAASWMLGVFFFAPLWRRSNILTDNEFIELRYSGKAATFLRGFRAVWEGVFINAVIMGWVILAMSKIVTILFPMLDKWETIVICLVLATTYSVASGFWAVVVTDLFQFVLAMVGAVSLALISLSRVGGVESLKEQLAATYPNGLAYLNFAPEVGSELMPMATFVAFLTVNWWANRSADSGGYLAQRMFSARDERHALAGTLWFNIAHFCLRPWPWIIVALVSMVVYPNLSDPELGYPRMAMDYLPTGLKGIMMASFLAAFMSTIDTHLNWGSSYLLNDLYRRFIATGKQEKHYVMVSRIAVVLLMLVGGFVAYMMNTIKGGWEFLYAMTSGIGGVYIARWFWWRVNAWSEITAWISSAVIYAFLKLNYPDAVYGWVIIMVGLGSTFAWAAATFLTHPTETQKLEMFFKRVRPASPGWRRISRNLNENVATYTFRDLFNWLAGIGLVYSLLFATGKWIFFSLREASLYILLAIVCAIWIKKNALDPLVRNRGSASQ